MPITADVGKIRFEEAAEDLLTDYRVKKKRSLRTVTLRIRKHLTPFFGERRLASITPPLARQYVTRRQAAGAANATINRDLITLKRMFNLAMQDGKLMTRPYIPLLKENNVRKGFFEREQFQAMTNRCLTTCGVSRNSPS
jgi:integrase